MSRNIDLRESVVRQQEAMGHIVRTGQEANYLARAVDPLRSRGFCPGEIDRGNGLCAERRRECRHRKEGCYYCSTQHELLLGLLLAASGSLSVLPREVVLMYGDSAAINAAGREISPTLSSTGSRGCSIFCTFVAHSANSYSKHAS